MFSDLANCIHEWAGTRHPFIGSTIPVLPALTYQQYHDGDQLGALADSAQGLQESMNNMETDIQRINERLVKIESTLANIESTLNENIIIVQGYDIIGAFQSAFVKDG